MNEPIYLDAEYESIRHIFDERGHMAGKLPGMTVAVIPSDRADRVLALDARIQKIQKIAPFVIGGMIMVISFLAGLYF